MSAAVTRAEAVRESAQYSEKAELKRGYSRADKDRFRFLSMEHAKDALSLKMLLDEIGGP